MLAEAGRWPLALRWAKKIAKFYNRLIDAPAESLLGRALRVSAALAEESTGVPLNRRSWMAQVKTAFDRWNINLDTESFEKVNVDNVCESWKMWYLDRVRNLSGTKIHHYMHEVRGGLPLDKYSPAAYLTEVPQRQLRRPLGQLRMGAHWLREETGRWERLEREERHCPHCWSTGHQTVETVEHMLFHCPTHDDIRDRYLGLNFNNISLLDFFEQKPRQLASFARAVQQRHEELITQ